MVCWERDTYKEAKHSQHCQGLVEEWIMCSVRMLKAVVNSAYWNQQKHHQKKRDNGAGALKAKYEFKIVEEKMCIPERITGVGNRESHSVALKLCLLGQLQHRQGICWKCRFLEITAETLDVLGQGSATCVLTSLPADSYTHSGLRATVTVHWWYQVKEKIYWQNIDILHIKEISRLI